MGGSQRASDQQLKGDVSITLQDLQWAMSAVKPSAMREVAVDVPKVIAPLTVGFSRSSDFKRHFQGSDGPFSNTCDVPKEEMGRKKELSAVILGYRVKGKKQNWKSMAEGNDSGEGARMCLLCAVSQVEEKETGKSLLPPL